VTCGNFDHAGISSQVDATCGDDAFEQNKRASSNHKSSNFH
jgi:hypothetical protein